MKSNKPVAKAARKRVAKPPARLRQALLLTGNERAVFEQMRDDPAIKKIVLTHGRRIDLGGENVGTCALDGPEGRYHLLRAKRVGCRENRDCRAVISSSKVDALAMAAAFYPLPYRDVWITGLPRNDFIVCPEECLPADFREEGCRLEQERAGRKLVLFAPTFKNAQADGYCRFPEDEIAWLRGWLDANDAVLGVREHMADRAHAYYGQLSSLGVLDLSSKRYPSIEVLYRQSAMLVTDYSSCAIDFMLTGRPAISFAYDFERYAGSERGLFYDLEHVFPGPVCRDFGEFAKALEEAFSSMAADPGRSWRTRFFFEYVDDANARRVVERAKGLYAAEADPADKLAERAA